MDGKDPQGEDSGTIDPGLKNLGGDDEAKSTQEHPPQPQRSPSPPNLPRSSPGTGCDQIHRHTIEIPAEKAGLIVGKDRKTVARIEWFSGAWIKLEAGPCTSGEHRKMHILGTKAQIESAIDQIDEMLKMCFVQDYVPFFDGYVVAPSMWDETDPSACIAIASPLSGFPVRLPNLRTRPIEPEAGEEAQSSSDHESPSKDSRRLSERQSSSKRAYDPPYPPNASKR